MKMCAFVRSSNRTVSDCETFLREAEKRFDISERVCHHDDAPFIGAFLLVKARAVADLPDLFAAGE